MRRVGGALLAAGLALLIVTTPLLAGPPAATDPGVRAGPPAAGSPLPTLSGAQLALFHDAADTFAEVNSVSGTWLGADSGGLGPRFNGNSCAGCHVQPAPGGSSPPTNPQIAVAHEFGATNLVPSFVVADGPVREVRFKANADGTPDGGVHDLFTITGRQDAPGCALAQPDFSNTANLSFRIPTPVFGGGLIEAIPDNTILANMAAQASDKAARGIKGHPNREGNTGTITRFGWKAQNKSLLMFAGEAYLVEQGVSNELFTNERDDLPPGCQFTAVPEDLTSAGQSGDKILSDMAMFSWFMRLLAAPAPTRPDPPADGDQVFSRIGCDLCHTPLLQTGHDAVAALDHQAVPLYSDLLLHDMGTALADGVSQGLAGGREFRTAPLWGLGQRVFFLHDGRTRDLVQAIQAHASQGSEATQVVEAFNGLNGQQQQALLNFLRSR